MIKKLIFWSFLLLAAVQIWKTPEFQKFKDENIDKIWHLASDTAAPKQHNSAQRYAYKMKYWMENFSENEKAFISELSKNQVQFNRFVTDYCFEAKLYHPKLTQANLHLSCEKAKEVHTP